MKFTMPPLPPAIPDVIRPRLGSPVSGCSTLITSAPQSASTAPAAGTNVHEATSNTRTPASALAMMAFPLRVSSVVATDGATQGT